MSKANSMEQEVIALFFNATTWAGIAINATASVLASTWVSLHTADPGEAGTAVTNEIAYTGYARVGVVRTTGGWTCTTGTASNAAAITFPLCSATTVTGAATHFGIVETSGVAAGKLYYSGALTATLNISNGITPSFAIGALTVTED